MSFKYNNCISTVISSVIFLSFYGQLGSGNDAQNDTHEQSTSNKIYLENIKFHKTELCSAPNLSIGSCPSELECSKLGNECLICQCSLNCQYGVASIAVCEVPEEINCTGSRTFNRTFVCSYCYQSDEKLHSCEENVECDSVADPMKRNYVSNCTVDNDHICLGRRHFHKLRPCNWTGGHRWFTALLLSVTLGGFGADRYVIESAACRPIVQYLRY